MCQWRFCWSTHSLCRSSYPWLLTSSLLQESKNLFEPPLLVTVHSNHWWVYAGYLLRLSSWSVRMLLCQETHKTPSNPNPRYPILPLCRLRYIFLDPRRSAEWLAFLNSFHYPSLLLRSPRHPIEHVPHKTNWATELEVWKGIEENFSILLSIILKPNLALMK